MTWVRIDDQFHSHPKVARAWKCRPALGLHVQAMSYCACYLTDGVVDREFVEQKEPRRRERDRATAALVDAGLWRPHPNGFQINDWLDYNPSRAATLERRRQDSERKRNGRESESRRIPNGVRDESARPDPTRPVKKENQQRKRSDSTRMGGPTHDDANAAGLSWAAVKAERQRQHLEDQDDAR